MNALASDEFVNQHFSRMIAKIRYVNDGFQNDHMPTRMSRKIYNFYDDHYDSKQTYAKFVKDIAPIISLTIEWWVMKNGFTNPR